MCIRDSLGTIAQICRAVSSQLRHVSSYRQSEKNLLNSNVSPTCPHNMANFGPLAAEIGSGVSTGFASWQRYCTPLWYWASAKICGVEQRAPPLFGRAAITLGIGPHSSFSCFHRRYLLSFAAIAVVRHVVHVIVVNKPQTRANAVIRSSPVTVAN